MAKIVTFLFIQIFIMVSYLSSFVYLRVSNKKWNRIRVICCLSCSEPLQLLQISFANRFKSPDSHLNTAKNNDLAHALMLSVIILNNTLQQSNS